MFICIHPINLESSWYIIKDMFGWNSPFVIISQMGNLQNIQYHVVRRGGHGVLLYCSEIQCTVLSYTEIYYNVLNCTVLYCTVIYCTVLYCTILYCTVLYITIVIGGDRGPKYNLYISLWYRLTILGGSKNITYLYSKSC